MRKFITAREANLLTFHKIRVSLVRLAHQTGGISLNVMGMIYAAIQKLDQAESLYKEEIEKGRGKEKKEDASR